MTYVLFQENQIPLTKSQKEKGIEPTYTVDRVKTVNTKDEANAFVNKDSESRSWRHLD